MRAATPVTAAASARAVLLAATATVAAGLTGLPALAAEPGNEPSAESAAESNSGSAAESARDPLPDMAFIEYLGSWEEDDRDWIALAGTATEEDERRPAPAKREEDEEKSRDEETG